jgi:hypothetical protein
MISRIFEKNKRRPSLKDIEQTITCLWVEQQLNRIRDCLEEHGADDEMLDAIDYLLEENNDYWLDPQIADDLRAGKLPESPSGDFMKDCRALSA